MGDSRQGGTHALLEAADAYVPVAAFVLLVLLQGGYYAGATCAVALVASVLAMARTAARRADAPPTRCLACVAPLVAIGLACLASARAHGATATMLLGAVRWLALAGLALWSAPSAAVRPRMLFALAVAGVLLSCLGILMHLGVLPLAGTLSAGRLMFTFQYANAAGILFGVTVVLCLGSSRPWLRLAAVLPAVALLLTRSVGAFCVLALALVALAVRWLRTRASRGRVLALAGGGAFAVAMGVLALGGRLGEAGRTLAERLVQARDAASLLAGNVALGIGPDQWQLACPVVQTASYRAAVVHASYLQAALDGGVVALAGMVVLAACALRATWVRREAAPFACVAMVAVHALLDFDFQFSALVWLLCLLGGGLPADGESRSRHAGTFSVVLWWAVAIVATCASALGIRRAARMSELRAAGASGDGAAALRLLQSDDRLADDPIARAVAAGALCAEGSYDQVLALTDGSDVGAVGSTHALTSATALCRVVSLDGLGDGKAAESELAAALAARPHDEDLRAAAAEWESARR